MWVRPAALPVLPLATTRVIYTGADEGDGGLRPARRTDPLEPKPSARNFLDVAQRPSPYRRSARRRLSQASQRSPVRILNNSLRSAKSISRAGADPGVSGAPMTVI